MEIGIIGLPRSGKTTVFLALGGESARVAASRAGYADPVVATVPIPDKRVDALAALVGCARAVHAMVRYTDLPGLPPEQIERRHGLPDSHLQYLARVDALLAVIRAFDDGSGIPVQIEADRESLETELIVTDLERVEKRRQKLQKHVGRVSGKEREEAEIELAGLAKVYEALEQGRPARIVDLADREEVPLRSLGLVSQKPVAWLLNIDEQALENGMDRTAPLIEKGLGARAVCTQVDGEMEKEIAELDDGSREEFMAGYGISEPAASKVVTTCFRLLGRIQFFTANEKEAHAWTVPEGATALEAAAAVHSDFARGFIRAEIVAFEKLQEAGSLAEARRNGSLRAEGKNHVVRDGDVIQFLFHA